MKRVLLLLLLLYAALLFSGCSTNVTDASAAYTLPPVTSSDAAPHGMDSLSYTATVPLCLPSVDGQKLLTEYTELTFNRNEVNVRQVVEALLAFPGNDRVSSLGGDVTLSLYGRDPVEVSRGICTVNLSSSALYLEHSKLYTLCLSLAATLSWQENISYVNVLVCDLAVSLDIAGYLPVGSVSAGSNEEISTLWELMEARRVPLGQNAANVPLNAAATLYFPLKDGTGFMPEVRNITFAGQTPAIMAEALLTAMGAGAQYLSGTCEMPFMPSLLTREPLISELADGSRMLTLYFSPNLEDRLLLMGIEPMCFTGAVVSTITGFIPNVSSVCIVSGSTMMTSLYCRGLGSLTFRDGVQRRNQYTFLLREQATIYLTRDDLLEPVTRSVAANDVHNLSVLFALLSDGPVETEEAAGFKAVLPQGFNDQDLLGASVSGNALLLNLSERFSFAVREQTMNEQLLCYSIVTTLCEASQLRRVRFFFAGDMEQSMGGSLFWAGDFMRNTSVIRSGN